MDNFGKYESEWETLGTHRGGMTKKRASHYRAPHIFMSFLHNAENRPIRDDQFRM